MFSKVLTKVQTLLRRQPSPRHQHCTVLIQFRRWAKLAKFLGFFPVSKHHLRCYHAEQEQPEEVKKKGHCLFVSWSFLISLFVFLYFSISILQPLQLYISVYVTNELRFTSTDKFTLQVFLTGVHVVRGIAPIFPVTRVNRIMSAVQHMTKYDGRFKVAKGSLCFFDFAIFLLILGSIFVLISNYIVTESDFVEQITSDDDPIFPLSYLLTHSKVVTSVFIEAGHVYAEFAICFVVALMRYISKFVENRMKRLEEELTLLVEMKGQRATLDTATPTIEETLAEENKFGEKLKKLIKLVEIFNEVFQNYILGFFVFTVILVVVSIYMVVIIVRTASLFQGFVFLQQTKVVRGFYALGITGVHSIYRMLLLVNVGDRIQNAGRSLLTTVSLLDCTHFQRRSPHKTVKQLRWMLHGTEFMVKPWNIFILNRQMIMSVLGSVVTFVVVLIQFRVTDTQPPVSL